MNIAQVWARLDGTIAHVWLESIGTPDDNATRVAKFDADTHLQVYLQLSDNIKNVRYLDGALVLISPILPNVTVVDAIWIAAQEAQIAAAEFVGSQVVNAHNDLAALMSGLEGLSAADKGYALYCRMFAKRNNATPEVLAAIVDRSSAVAYITGLAEWQNLPGAVKQFEAKKLEADAFLCTVLLLVIPHT